MVIKEMINNVNLIEKFVSFTKTPLLIMVCQCKKIINVVLIL